MPCPWIAAHWRLASFEQAIKPVLAGQALLNLDETEVSIVGARVWLHTAGNARMTHYAVHPMRGQAAMEAIGILPPFTGVLCHAHWKPYYRYSGSQHALCNAHHVRGLERLRDYEADVLRFIDNANVAFSNNLGERDIRMVKFQQKISDCFRSWEGAQIFLPIRGYLSTCRKNGVAASEALAFVYQGRYPGFMSNGMLPAVVIAAE